MNVGNLLLEDGELDTIKRIHSESPFDFRLPDFKSSPLFCIKRSLRHEGKFLAAVIVKVDAEVYLFVNRETTTPEQRFEGLKILHQDLLLRAREMGFDQLYCVLPPSVEKSFGPRLESVGWKADRGWRRFTIDL